MTEDSVDTAPAVVIDMCDENCAWTICRVIAHLDQNVRMDILDLKYRYVIYIQIQKVVELFTKFQ